MTSEKDRAIIRAAAMVEIACFVSTRADQFRNGTSRGKATAQAMDVLAGDLRDRAVRERGPVNAQKLLHKRLRS
jgi:hypothetical protein